MNYINNNSNKKLNYFFSSWLNDPYSLQYRPIEQSYTVNVNEHFFWVLATNSCGHSTFHVQVILCVAKLAIRNALIGIFSRPT
jgi:hypothetical protein